MTIQAVLSGFCGFAAVINILLCLYVFRMRLSIPVVMTGALLLACGFYCGGYAVELLAPNRELAVSALHLQYIGVSYIPAFIFLTIMSISGLELKVTGRLAGVLLGLSTAILIAVFTNGFHGLYYSRISMDTSGPFPVTVLEKGPLYWVFVAYLQFSVLAGNCLLFRTIVQKRRKELRVQAGILMSGSLIPWFANILYMTGNSPSGLDPSPFALSLMVFIFFWGALKRHMLIVIPVARDRIFEGMQDPMLILTPESQVIDFNPAASRLFPAVTMENRGESAAVLLRQSAPLLDQLRRTSREEHISLETAEGRRFFQSTLNPIQNRRNVRIAQILSLRDMTREIELIARLEELSTTDYLTGIYNRRQFMELFGKELQRARRNGSPISIVIIDLDNFKIINDTYGHEVGDTSLQEAVSVWKAGIRPADLLCRYGGEEFALLLPDIDPSSAIQVAERLRQALEEHIFPAGKKMIGITASFGVSGTDSVVDEAIDDLVKAADLALYRAKQQGRNMVKYVNLCSIR